MRTKTLLVAGAISALALTASLAQSVYSVNVVGYVNVPVVKGFNLIANPLDASPDNNLNSVMPVAVEGDGLLKWDPTAQGFLAPQTFVTGMGWVDPDFNPTTFTVGPGEGFFYNATDPTNITFVGDVRQGDLAANMILGFNLMSGLTPQSGDIQSFNFPAAEGDGILFWDANASPQGYKAPLTYVNGMGWTDSDLNPVTLNIEVGKGFFVNKFAVPLTWNLTFNVN